MGHKMHEVEQSLHSVAEEMKHLYPTVCFAEFRGCHNCGGVARVFPVYDPSTGVPTSRFGCWLYSAGDGKSSFFDGGVYPIDGMKDESHGCFVAHIRVNVFAFDAEEFRKTALSIAEEVSKCEQAALIAA